MRRRLFHSRKPLSPGSRVILFLTGLIVSIFLLDLRVRPYIQSISSYQAQIYGTRVINDAIYEELAKDNVRYDNLVTLTQNAQGGDHLPADRHGGAGAAPEPGDQCGAAGDR